MTAKPLLHPKTEASLAMILAHPPHALLLSGPPGVGKGTIATWLAAELLHTTPDKIADHPYVLQLAAVEGKAIGIEAIRDLERMTTLKVPGTNSIARVLLIHDAETLTVEAQNALLKTLEEPPHDTVIILVTSQTEALLPTIQSRVQTVDVTPPATSAVQDAIKVQYNLDAGHLKQAMALSSGLPGIAFALADNNTDHPLVTAAQTARQLLTQSSFERLCQVDLLAKDKQTTSNTLYMLVQMSRAALISSKSPRWHKVLQASYDAEAALKQGGQPKLVLTNLMLSL